MQKKGMLKQNSGFTLIELVVSILVSSVVVLSAVLFLSVCLTNYRNTAAETELMMESQIAVNMIREVVMEATEPVKAEEYDGGAYYYFSVKTKGGQDGSSAEGSEYYHLFVHDVNGKRLLYHREEGPGLVSASGWIHSELLGNGMIDKADLKKYFLADYVQHMELNATANPQLMELVLQFDCSERIYQTSETILLRNTLPETSE